MVCTGSSYKDGPDTHGKLRKSIAFELTPIEGFVQAQENEDAEAENLADEPLETLRKKAIAGSADATTPKERKSLWRHRSKAISVYVLKRAGGNCEGCGAPAPFTKPNGQPYLEPHHIRRLSDGGPDHPRWVVGSARTAIDGRIIATTRQNITGGYRISLCDWNVINKVLLRLTNQVASAQADRETGAPLAVHRAADAP